MTKKKEIERYEGSRRDVTKSAPSRWDLGLSAWASDREVDLTKVSPHIADLILDTRAEADEDEAGFREQITIVESLDELPKNIRRDGTLKKLKFARVALEVDGETWLYLGLVHFCDDCAGCGKTKYDPPFSLMLINEDYDDKLFVKPRDAAQLATNMTAVARWMLNTQPGLCS